MLALYNTQLQINANVAMCAQLFIVYYVSDNKLLSFFKLSLQNIH